MRAARLSRRERAVTRCYESADAIACNGIDKAVVANFAKTAYHVGAASQPRTLPRAAGTIDRLKRLERKGSPQRAGEMADARLVSVIVPVHNGEAFIGRVLESVLQQTHRCLEVIVVDDGSNDATAAVVERVAKQDSRVRLTSRANGGVAAARNTALQMARGD